MHVLYVDTAGAVENTDQSCYVMAGVSVFERSIHYMNQDIEDCVQRFGLGDPGAIELDGSAMYAGRGRPWRAIPDRKVREAMIDAALATIPDRGGARLFAVVVEKDAILAEDPILLAFEEICNRFNFFLQRLRRANPRDAQRGLIVLSSGRHDAALMDHARLITQEGSRWAKFGNLADLPHVVSARTSRPLQIAGLLAYACWRRYEHADARFLDPLLDLFDEDGGVMHGLVHRRIEHDCPCPACASRRLARPLGFMRKTGARETRLRYE